MIKLTDLLSEKIKPRQKISKKEWSKIKKFNKHIGQDGTHYVVQLDKKLGTILVPVIVEEKLTNEAIDLKDAGGEIFDTIIAFKKIYEKSPHKKNRKINMYIKQLLKIEQQISDVIGDLD
tara:strand:- start:45 stop:404 length:360 start_codon:yes stop_codon:yes gene_type:complete